MYCLYLCLPFFEPFPSFPNPQPAFLGCASEAPQELRAVSPLRNADVSESYSNGEPQPRSLEAPRRNSVPRLLPWEFQENAVETMCFSLLFFLFFYKQNRFLFKKRLMQIFSLTLGFFRWWEWTVHRVEVFFLLKKIGAILRTFDAWKKFQTIFSLSQMFSSFLMVMNPTAEIRKKNHQNKQIQANQNGFHSGTNH